MLALFLFMGSAAAETPLASCLQALACRNGAHDTCPAPTEWVRNVSGCLAAHPDEIQANSDLRQLLIKSSLAPSCPTCRSEEDMNELKPPVPTRRQLRPERYPFQTDDGWVVVGLSAGPEWIPLNSETDLAYASTLPVDYAAVVQREEGIWRKRRPRYGGFAEVELTRDGSTDCASRGGQWILVEVKTLQLSLVPERFEAHWRLDLSGPETNCTP